MSASALRPAEEPPAPPRTAERERLAEAVARHREAAARLQRMRAAAEQSRRDSVDRMIELSAAEDMLAEARAAEPRRRVAQLLGESDAGGPTVADAQLALDVARNEHEIAHSATAILQQEINGGAGSAEMLASIAETRRDNALAAVLATDPGIDALIEAFDAARARVATLAEVLKFLGSRLPEKHQRWNSINRATPPVEPLVPAWREAIAKLEVGEIDTPLPSTE